MAQPKILRGTYFSLMLGNGGSPETFAALCGFNTRNFAHQSNTSDVFTRDCAIPEDKPKRNVIVTGEQWDLSGTGVFNRSNFAQIQAADDGQPHNWRYLFTEPASDLVYQGYYQGAGVITNFQLNSDDGAFATVSLTIQSTGPWTWTVV